MPIQLQDGAKLLRHFIFLFLLSAVCVLVAWARGRQWGDLSSRKHSGEVLTDKELETLRRSRRSFLLWLLASLILAALSFYALE